jgi:hypothetical protein
MAAAVSWVPAPIASFMEGARQIKKHGKKKVIVWRNSWREMFLELPHENTGFEALHFHGESE